MLRMKSKNYESQTRTSLTLLTSTLFIRSFVPLVLVYTQTFFFFFQAGHHSHLQKSQSKVGDTIFFHLTTITFPLATNPHNHHHIFHIIRNNRLPFTTTASTAFFPHHLPITVIPSSSAAVQSSAITRIPPSTTAFQQSHNAAPPTASLLY